MPTPTDSKLPVYQDPYSVVCFCVLILAALVYGSNFAGPARGWLDNVMPPPVQAPSTPEPSLPAAVPAASAQPAAPATPADQALADFRAWAAAPGQRTNSHIRNTTVSTKGSEITLQLEVDARYVKLTADRRLKAAEA